MHPVVFSSGTVIHTSFTRMSRPTSVLWVIEKRFCWWLKNYSLNCTMEECNMNQKSIPVIIIRRSQNTCSTRRLSTTLVFLMLVYKTMCSDLSFFVSRSHRSSNWVYCWQSSTSLSSFTSIPCMKLRMASPFSGVLGWCLVLEYCHRLASDCSNRL